jgi:hypothetical protein
VRAKKDDKKQQQGKTRRTEPRCSQGALCETGLSCVLRTLRKKCTHPDCQQHMARYCPQCFLLFVVQIGASLCHVCFLSRGLPTVPLVFKSMNGMQHNMALFRTNVCAFFFFWKSMRVNDTQLLLWRRCALPGLVSVQTHAALVLCR